MHVLFAVRCDVTTLQPKKKVVSVTPGASQAKPAFVGRFLPHVAWLPVQAYSECSLRGFVGGVRGCRGRSAWKVCRAGCVAGCVGEQQRPGGGQFGWHSSGSVGGKVGIGCGGCTTWCQAVDGIIEGYEDDTLGLVEGRELAVGARERIFSLRRTLGPACATLSSVILVTSRPKPPETAAANAVSSGDGAAADNYNGGIPSEKGSRCSNHCLVSFTKLWSSSCELFRTCSIGKQD